MKVITLVDIIFNKLVDILGAVIEYKYPLHIGIWEALQLREYSQQLAYNDVGMMGFRYFYTPFHSENGI